MTLRTRKGNTCGFSRPLGNEGRACPAPRHLLGHSDAATTMVHPRVEPRRPGCPQPTRQNMILTPDISPDTLASARNRRSFHLLLHQTCLFAATSREERSM
jgi:hypothetical protein